MVTVEGIIRGWLKIEDGSGFLNKLLHIIGVGFVNKLFLKGFFFTDIIA